MLEKVLLRMFKDPIKVHFVKMLLSLKYRKFNIGSGGINIDNTWFPTDIQTLDITKEEDWKRHLLFIRLRNIMAEHVWEHLDEKDTLKANQNCFKFLEKGGRLRIAVPDGFMPNLDYINHV